MEKTEIWIFKRETNKDGRWLRFTFLWTNKKNDLYSQISKSEKGGETTLAGLHITFPIFVILIARNEETVKNWRKNKHNMVWSQWGLAWVVEVFLTCWMIKCDVEEYDKQVQVKLIRVGASFLPVLNLEDSGNSRPLCLFYILLSL